MILEELKLYHIYNQGNNRQKIFFRQENYLFFLKKIKIHILPHADILAWCLMPNHFHLMVYVHTFESSVNEQSELNLNDNEMANSVSLMEYPQACFNYIYNNPVKAKLVQHPEDWEFSSYRDYFGLRNGKLINKDRASVYGLDLKL